MPRGRPRGRKKGVVKEFDENALKGKETSIFKQYLKLNGDDRNAAIAQFQDWQRRNSQTSDASDPVLQRIKEMFEVEAETNNKLNLGRYGVTVVRMKGRGTKGFSVTRNEKADGGTQATAKTAKARSAGATTVPDGNSEPTDSDVTAEISAIN